MPGAGRGRLCLKPPQPDQSELKPESKLYVPLTPRRCAGDLAEIRGLTVVVRQAELRCIAEIEGLSAELKFPSFRELEVLGYGKIDVAGRRSIVRLQSQIALSQRCGRREIGDVEPLTGIASACRRGVWILAGHQVRVA